MSISWNPTWSKRASTCTPHLTNMVTKSCCRSTMMSPLNPITRHFTTFLTLSRCGPFTIGLQYLWSRSVPLGKAILHIKSNTGKGNTWSAANFSSDPVLFSPPNMGWFRTKPRILNGFKSVSAVYTKTFHEYYTKSRICLLKWKRKICETTLWEVDMHRKKPAWKRWKLYWHHSQSHKGSI